MGFLTVLRIILAIINVIVNLIGFVFSVVIIAVGIIGLVALNYFFSSMNDNLLYYNVGFALCTSVGVFACIFTVAAIIGSYMACFPANKVVKLIAIIFLGLHLVAFIVVFILALAGVIVTFVFRDQVAENFVPVLNRVINESYSLDFNSTTLTVELVQTTLGCCGVNGPSDFATYPGYANVTNFLPLSCCQGIPCTIATVNETVGCGPIIQAQLVAYYNILGGIGVFELVVILLFILVEIILILLVLKGDESDGMKIV